MRLSKEAWTYRYNRLASWVRGEHCDGIRDRWTNADMLWAYKLGLKHSSKKPDEFR